MTDNRPDTILPNKFYSMAEAKELLKGRAKIESLREFGLVSPGKDYLGQVIIDAYVRYCAKIASERGPGLQKGDADAIFENRRTKSASPPRVCGSRKGSRSVQSPRQRPRIHPSKTEGLPVESQWTKFERLSKKGVSETERSG